MEVVLDLTGQLIGPTGFFVAAEPGFSLGQADFTTTLNFENSDNVTHLLVSNFTGTNGQDLDTNDDGILDLTPWDELVDLIALIEEENPPQDTEYHYGPPTIGPDGGSVPGHGFRCEPAGTWTIGALDPAEGTDTPAAPNLDCDGDICPWDLDGNGIVGASDLLALLVVWGTDPGGPPDFDGDGNVGASDLLELLANWGPCS